ncbi:hypothetical protein M5K25_011669 [Dendrobium thyrsiflorum]|uniref:Uncharacterized protein n=1 Tax=Dendrobium thyrsiflorum TaxID=117978 RepID=A0ABD0V3T6_DENTH
MSDDEVKEEKELDLASCDVVTKYRNAAERLISLFSWWFRSASQSVGICEKGDAFIMQAGSMYKNAKKKIERGVAFPTCISMNHTVCHFSPLWVYCFGCTNSCTSRRASKRAADVITAANTAAEVALRLVRLGKKVLSFTELSASKKIENSAEAEPSADDENGGAAHE